METVVSIKDIAFSIAENFEAVGHLRDAEDILQELETQIFPRE